MKPVAYALPVAAALVLAGCGSDLTPGPLLPPVSSPAAPELTPSPPNPTPAAEPAQPAGATPTGAPPPHHPRPPVPQESIRPDAPCTPPGALGYTTAGDLMQCTAHLNDRPRWHPAVLEQ
jgi:hypothetical protein